MTKFHIFFDGIFEVKAGTAEEARRVALEQVSTLTPVLMFDVGKACPVNE